MAALGEAGRARAARGRPRHPRARERRDDARAARRLDREGPRPRRLRPACLRRLRPGPRRRSRGRARREDRDRAAARGPLLRRRPALRARRAPRRPLLPHQRARAATSTSCAPLEDDMREQITAGIREAGELEWQRLADVRYRGQNWSIPVDWPGEIDHESTALLVERFEDAHEQLYGTRLEPGSPVDVRALRLIALGPERDAFALVGDPARRRARRRDPPTSARATARSRFPFAPAPRSPTPSTGPLLIDEYDTTVVVPPGWTVALDRRTGALVLEHVAVGEQGADAVDYAASIARAARRERARDRSRRDGDDDLPHRALRGRPRCDGLLGGALRLRPARRSPRR